MSPREIVLLLCALFRGLGSKAVPFGRLCEANVTKNIYDTGSLHCTLDNIKEAFLIQRCWFHAAHVSSLDTLTFSAPSDFGAKLLSRLRLPQEIETTSGFMHFVSSHQACLHACMQVDLSRLGCAPPRL